MKPQDLNKLPQKPGVYLMKGAKGVILYIGKAKNLQARVKQYFLPGRDSRQMVPILVEQVQEVETIIVRSEKEALLLENNLIKEHKPKYNVLLKDDKTYIALKVNTDHEWPQVSIVRYSGKPKEKGQYFGPYTGAYAARQTLDLLHRLFPLRQCSDEELKRRTRPCILYDMKRCIAPCVGKCTPAEYERQVDRTVRFLRGQDTEVLEELYREMEQASEKMEYERAAEVLKKIRAIERTVEKQHVEKPLGGDADVIGLYREGSQAQLSKMIFRSGRLMGVLQFHFDHVVQDDEELLTSFLIQHYALAEERPKEALIPLKLEDSTELSEICGLKVLSPVKGEKAEKIKMAASNAESEFKRRIDRSAILEKTLLELQEKLKLENFPERIECLDSSSLSLSEPVAAVVVFEKGTEEKSSYRKYKIKAANAGDDYGAIYEVLMRRYSKLQLEGTLPDLLVVDGGKGQLNVALRVFSELQIVTVDVISLVKEKGRHDKGITGEGVFLANAKDPLFLRKNSGALFLLQRIRDEAHRFAIAFQRKRREKKQFTTALDAIPGIGPQKRKNLLKVLGSVKRIATASEEELLQVPKITQRDAKIICAYFRDKS